MNHKTKFWGWLALPLLLILLGFGQADARTNFGFGFSVGNYDYLPYEHSGTNFSVNFSNVFDDYGYWVDVPRFGRSWRPYATSGWRPYLYGHWIYTGYGPYWEGYEPWAWAGYHYGNWIWTEEFGWVWVPGNDWHAGRVVWGYSNDALGWMPAPPAGYGYGCGYLSYGNCGYSDPFYSPRFSNISFNLWVFIDRHRFFNDNYADYYLGRDYARNVFVRRAVRIEPRVQRVQLERIVGRRVNEVPVRVKNLRLQNRTVRAVIPEGAETRIRKNGERVVRNVIAPAVSQKRHVAEERDKSRNYERDRDRNDRDTVDRQKSERHGDDRSTNRGEVRPDNRPDRDRDRDFSNRARQKNDNRDRQFESRSRHSNSSDRREIERREADARERALRERDNRDSRERSVDRSREARSREVREREINEARERAARDNRRDEERRPTVDRDRRPQPQVERRVEPRQDQRKTESKKKDSDRRKHNNNKPDHD